MVPSAYKLFAGIGDPRVADQTMHSLAEVLFAAFCEFGCRDGHAQSTKARLEFLRR